MELFITINPDESPFPKTLKQIKDEIHDHLPDAQFVVCREVAKHEHYHIYYKDPNQSYSDKSRNDVRRKLRIIFPGEIRISKRQVEDSIRAIAYTIKDGNYITHAIDWYTWLQAKKTTHPKPKGFSAQLAEFHLNSSGKDDRQLTCEVLKIFEDNNVPIDIYRVAKIVRLALSKTNNNYRQGLIDRILCEI